MDLGQSSAQRNTTVRDLPVVDFASGKDRTTAPYSFPTVGQRIPRIGMQKESVNTGLDAAAVSSFLSCDALRRGKHCTIRSGFSPNPRPSDFESPYGEPQGWTSHRRIGISNVATEHLGAETVVLVRL